MAKTEPKAMRFEQDVERYINSQKGKNFSEKFHNLVRKFKDDEVKMEQRIKHLDDEIKSREKRLKDLNDMLGKGFYLENAFKDLKASIERSQGYLDNFLLKDIERIEKRGW